MRNLYVFMVLVLFTISASAQTTTTYRSEPIDGNNTFNQTYEKFTTTRAELPAYVTWDAQWLYIGYSGSTPNGSLTDNSRAIHVYIDTDPQLVPITGTGSTSGDAWNWNPTLPFTANYHYVFKTTNNVEVKRKFNGGGWGDFDFLTDNYKNGSTGYWEVKISRASLGNANAWNIVAYVEEDWTGGSAWISGGLPQGLFTNTQIQGNITFNDKFLNVQFVDKMAPNAGFHKENWGWSVRLKAISSGARDTTAMAGMFVNASNGYDDGIDLPKPPSVPSNFIEVFFPHTSWGSAMGPNYERDFKLITDLSATTSIWDFTVNTDVLGSITLSAASFQNVPTTYAITLKDLVTEEETDLRTSSYTYSNNPAEATARNFQLIIGVTLSDPTISVDPTSLSFGNVKTNATKTLAVVIGNTGDQTLNVTNLVVSGTGYSLEETTTTTTLNTNDTIVRHIKFAPNAEGLFNGTFTISSNDPANPSFEVSLTGNGVLAVPGLTFYTDSLGFGSVIVGNTGQGSIWIGNKAGDGVDLVVSGVTLSGTGAAAFQSLTQTPKTIPAGDSLQFSFSFTPSALGYFGATISVASNDPASPKSIPIGGTGTNDVSTKNFPAGWNLMSIPLNPVSNLASDIIGDDIASFYLYKYSGGTYVSSSTIDPTEGYWLGIDQATTVDVTGTPILTDQTTALGQGWDLIASPFTVGTPKANIRILQGQSVFTIDEAVTANLVQSNIYKYDNPTKTYETVTTLSPWNGNWFFTLVADLSIKYIYSLPSDFLTPKELPEIEVTPSNWFVNILSEMNGIKDNFLTFGTNQDATDGFDNRFDNVKPPISPASNAIEAYFFQSDWLSLASKYASNIQAPLQNNVNKTWSFKVYSKAAGTYKLSWNDIIAQIPQEIRDNYNFILRGPGITSGINMLNQTAYEFSASAGATYSFVINSSPVGIDDEVMNLDFKLGQNYPNPFNPSTTISFSIKEAGQVTLKVYDVLGNEVSTLINEVKQPGRYDVRFEAANLPSGTYFYKLVQGKNSEIKKLMLLK